MILLVLVLFLILVAGGGFAVHALWWLAIFLLVLAAFAYASGQRF